MTLTCYKFKFSWNFARFRTFGRQTTAKRMELDSYCQRQNCIGH